MATGAKSIGECHMSELGIPGLNLKIASMLRERDSQTVAIERIKITPAINRSLLKTLRRNVKRLTNDIATASRWLDKRMREADQARSA